MTMFRSPNAGAITLFSNDARAIVFAFTDAAGEPQVLDGRTFVFVARLSAMRVPIIGPLDMELAEDGMSVVALVTSVQASALYDAASGKAVSYDVVETTDGATTTRWTGRVAFVISPDIGGDAPPFYRDMPFAEVIISAQAVAVSERGGAGRTGGVTPEAQELIAQVRTEVEQAGATAGGIALEAVAPRVAEAQGAAAVADNARIAALGHAGAAALAAQASDANRVVVAQALIDADEQTTIARNAAAEATEALLTVREQRWGRWTEGVSYGALARVDVVFDGDDIFASNVPHTATSGNRPVAGTSTTQWQYLGPIAAIGPEAAAQIASLNGMISLSGSKARITLGDGKGNKFFIYDAVRKVLSTQAGHMMLEGVLTKLLTPDGKGSLLIGENELSIPGVTWRRRADGRVGITASYNNVRWLDMAPERFALAGWLMRPLPGGGRAIGRIDGSIVLSDTPGGRAVRYMGKHGPFVHMEPGKYLFGGVFGMWKREDGARVFGTDTGEELIVRAAGETGPLLGSPIDVTTPHVGVDPATVAWINANLPDWPDDAHEPALLSVDSAAYGKRTAQLASSIVKIGKRWWMILYGRYNPSNPGQIGEGPGSYAFLRYCDDLDKGVWHEALYLLPALSNRTIHDPALFDLGDGRLGVGYANASSTAGLRRCSYGFIIDNPEATRGNFRIGRPFFLGYGVLGFGRTAGGETLINIDEWRDPDLAPFVLGEDKHFVRLTFPGLDYSGPDKGRDRIVATLISNLPRLDARWNYDETTWVPLSGGRALVGWRTLDGYYTSVSTPGYAEWSAPALFPFTTPPSRAVFWETKSGLIGACFNHHATQRTNLTVAYTANEGQDWPWSLNIDPRPHFTSGGSRYASNYPSACPDEEYDYVSCGYGRTRDVQPNAGIGELIVRIDRNRIIAGTATLANAVKRYIAAPYES